jgi:hypothetical protein
MAMRRLKEVPMSSLRDPLTFSCTNCEAAIRGSAIFFVGLPFCCAGCVAGGPCTCSYDVESMTVQSPARPVRDRGRAAVEVAAGPGTAGERFVAEEPAVTEEPPAVLVAALREEQLVRTG